MISGNIRDNYNYGLTTNCIFCQVLLAYVEVFCLFCIHAYLCVMWFDDIKHYKRDGYRTSDG